MKKKKAYLIILISVFFIFNSVAKAQSHYDTIFFDAPELKVNNNSFLSDLDTMLTDFYLPCGRRDSNMVYAMYVEDVYLFTIIKAPSYFGRIAGAKGFFKVNDTYIFVLPAIWGTTQHYKEEKENQNID